MAEKKPRVKKSLIPLENVSLEPEDYLDYSSTLIRLGLFRLEKQLRDEGKLIGDGAGGSLAEPAIELSMEQVQYLNMRMRGIRIAESCKALKIDVSAPMLWEEQYGKNSVYGYCMEIIRRSQALLLEDEVWSRAMHDDSKGLMSMFALKSRMPEYKDNAVAGGGGIVVVNLSVDGKKYEVDDSINAIEVESEEV